jgi:hypothetical protein
MHDGWRTVAINLVAMRIQPPSYSGPIMSQKFSRFPRKPSWLRGYQSRNWYGRKPQFPPGRDPQIDLFDLGWMQLNLPKITDLTEGERQALQRDLRDLAEFYLTWAITSPLGLQVGSNEIPPSKRARWVEQQLINPARTLLDALSDANAVRRSAGPDRMNAAEPNRGVLIRELENVVGHASEIRAGLVDRAKSRNTNQTTEFKVDMAQKLKNVFQRYFHRPTTLGTYDPEYGRSSDFFSFIVACSSHILGQKDKISEHVLKKLY